MICNLIAFRYMGSRSHWYSLGTKKVPSIDLKKRTEDDSFVRNVLYR